MATRSSGLGRGLEALMPTEKRTPEKAATSAVNTVKVAEKPSATTTSAATQTPDNGRPVDVFFSNNKVDTAKATWDAAASGGRIGLTKPEAKPAQGGATGRSISDNAKLNNDAKNSESDGALETIDHTDVRQQESSDSGLKPVTGARFAEISIAKIKPNSKQPRTYFAEAELAELVDSIKEIGVLQPIVVRESGDGYELIMGERRWRASTMAGLTEIPAIIRETDDVAMLRDALLENLHRANLNPLEEATAYRQLLDDFECSQEELATRIARSRPQITNTLRLLKLPPLVQRRVALGAISAGHARALLGLNTPEEMEQLAQRIISDGLSVRAVEEIVADRHAQADPARAVTRPARLHLAETKEIAKKLTERFNTNVKVKLTAGHGQIAVDFKDFEDLNRVLALLAPDLPN